MIASRIDLNSMFTSEKGQHILIVEDDPDITELLSYNLEKEGYMVETVDNGLSAIQLAQNTPPTLILLDIMLPEMDGMEVCRQLRNTPQLDNTYIVFLTHNFRVENKVMKIRFFRFRKFQFNEILLLLFI